MTPEEQLLRIAALQRRFINFDTDIKRLWKRASLSPQGYVGTPAAAEAPLITTTLPPTTTTGSPPLQNRYCADEPFGYPSVNFTITVAGFGGVCSSMGQDTWNGAYVFTCEQADGANPIATGSGIVLRADNVSSCGQAVSGFAFGYPGVLPYFYQLDVSDSATVTLTYKAPGLPGAGFEVELSSSGIGPERVVARLNDGFPTPGVTHAFSTYVQYDAEADAGLTYGSGITSMGTVTVKADPV